MHNCQSHSSQAQHMAAALSEEEVNLPLSLSAASPVLGEEEVSFELEKVNKNTMFPFFLHRR